MSPLSPEIWSPWVLERFNEWATHHSYLKKEREKSMEDYEGSKVIFEYVKRNGIKKGIIVGFVDETDQTICVGFSLCHKANDFDFDIGMLKAIDRGKDFHKKFNEKGFFVEVPIGLRIKILKFISRCKRYYRQAELSQWAKMFEGAHMDEQYKELKKILRKISTPLQTDTIDSVILCLDKGIEDDGYITIDRACEVIERLIHIMTVYNKGMGDLHAKN